MHKNLALVILSIIMVVCVNKPVTAQSGPIHKIVMQLSSNDTLVWKGLMNNLKNLKNGWGDSVMIEIVAHGPGIDFLNKSKTTQQEKITMFKKKGIRFIACENTMIERKVSKEEIIAEAEFVRMGIGEIILKQEQGWTYIKAGF